MSTPSSYTVELIDFQNPQTVRSFSGVTNDGIVQDPQHRYMPFRFLLLLDRSRYEFPMERYLVKFSPERAAIAEKMKAEQDARDRASKASEPPAIEAADHQKMN